MGMLINRENEKKGLFYEKMIILAKTGRQAEAESEMHKVLNSTKNADFKTQVIERVKELGIKIE